MRPMGAFSRPGVEKLKSKSKDTGLTITAISRKTGLMRATLYNKINGVSGFKASEIAAVSEVLQLSQEERE